MKIHRLIRYIIMFVILVVICAAARQLYHKAAYSISSVNAFELFAEETAESCYP